MALSDPRSLFGVHSATFYNFSTHDYYGELRVLENSSLSLASESIDLMGGSNKYSWSNEIGTITSEMTLNFSEYPNFVFELFGGNSPTDNAAESNGNCSTLTDYYGTVVNATTGIASVSVETGEEDELKFGKYVVKVVSGTTVDVYMSSDLDIGRGTDGEMQNDLLKITASPITIPDSGATVSLTGYGVEFTGGSGTVNLETAGAIGDTATFYVRPQNSDSMTVTIGEQTSQNWPFFGCIAMAAKQSDGQMFEVEALKCKGAGLPVNFQRATYSAAEITVKMLYDSSQDGVFKIRTVVPTTP